MLSFFETEVPGICPSNDSCKLSVYSHGNYPDPPNRPKGNYESCWNVKCGKDTWLYVKSELAYKLTYDCSIHPLGTSSPTSVLSKPRIQNRSEYKFSKLSMQFFQLRTKNSYFLPVSAKK